MLQKLAIPLLALACLPAQGQLQVSHALTPEKLIQDVLLGPGVQVSNVKFKGRIAGLASFTNPNVPIGIGAGIIMSTGTPADAIGVNDAPDISTDLLGGMDNILARIANGKTYDASVLEFDFVPESDSVYFNYFFASDEYPEYVGTTYNDVFAFHISGPGITSQVNIARLPNRKPVTVNTVNHISNTAWYVDNNPYDRMNRFQEKKAAKLNPVLLANFQYDGFTTVLTAKAPVHRGQTYHIRLAIADVGDGRFDSSVFLQRNSFISAPSLADFLTMMPTEDREISPRPLAITVAGDAMPDTTSGSPSPPGTDAAFSGTQPSPETPKEVKGALAQATVLFAFDASTLTTEEEAKLSALVTKWKKSPQQRLVIVGHTDAVGSATYNKALSEKRSDAVQQALLSQGVNAAQVQLLWVGEDQPVANNEDEQGRALNRRVEIYLMPK